MNDIERRIREAEDRTRRRLERAGTPPPSRHSVGELWKEIHQRLDSLRDEVSSRFRPALHQPVETPLDRVFLERGLSVLKHGVVESCFYNLRILAQEAILDELAADQLEPLRRAAESLATVRDELRLFLERRAPGGLRTGDLLPELGPVFERSLTNLETALAPGAERPRRVPEEVDQALSVLAETSRMLRESRVSLADVVRKAIAMETPRLEEARLRVELELGTADGRIHADQQALLAAIVELLRNAARHRAESNQQGLVRIAARETETNVELLLESSPALTPVVPLETLLEPGTSRNLGGGEGLASVRRVVSLCGGTVQLHHDDRSSVFGVHLAFPLRLPV